MNGVRHPVTEVVSLAIGVFVCLATLAVARVDERDCTGTGAQCYTNACDAPCDGFLCCETVALVYNICQHAQKKDCGDQQVDCATRQYWGLGPCVGNKCGQFADGGKKTLKNTGCVPKAPPA